MDRARLPGAASGLFRSIGLAIAPSHRTGFRLVPSPPRSQKVDNPNPALHGRPSSRPWGKGAILEQTKRLFIIGMPRSGTSWLGKIFDRHPLVLYRFEPDTVDRKGAPPYICAHDEVERYLPATRSYLERLAQVRTTKSVGSLPYFTKAYRSAPMDNLRLAMIFGLKSVERLNLCPRFTRNMTIPDLINKGRPEALVIKSIEAVGRVNLYRAAWPDSHAIVIVRHPCGQIASTLEGINRHKFASRTPLYDDRGLLGTLAVTEQAKRRDLTLDRLLAMSPVERLAWMWALPNEKAMEDVERDPNARTIRYRDLCTSPMELMSDLFRFAGISWDPLVEDFIRDSTNPQHATSDKYYSVFRNPELSVDRWRSTLGADDVAAIRKAIGDTAPGRLFRF